jgi:hypothetical protein
MLSKCLLYLLAFIETHHSIVNELFDFDSQLGVNLNTEPRITSPWLKKDQHLGHIPPRETSVQALF